MSAECRAQSAERRNIVGQGLAPAENLKHKKDCKLTVFWDIFSKKER